MKKMTVSDFGSKVEIPPLLYKHKGKKGQKTNCVSNSQLIKYPSVLRNMVNKLNSGLEFWLKTQK